MKDKYDINVSRLALYRARIKALVETNTEYEESYEKLGKYSHIIFYRNPGSMAILSSRFKIVDRPSKFNRFFLSSSRQKNGYLSGYRPFISIDGLSQKKIWGSSSKCCGNECQYWYISNCFCRI